MENAGKQRENILSFEADRGKYLACRLVAPKPQDSERLAGLIQTRGPPWLSSSDVQIPGPGSSQLAIA